MTAVEGTITYGQETIHYEVRFLRTRRTLGIEVHPDSRVLVRAPIGCPEALVTERVQKRAAWISRQLSEFERYRPRTPARQYVNGESQLYLGRQYRMKVVPARRGQGETRAGSYARPRAWGNHPGADQDAVASLVSRSRAGDLRRDIERESAFLQGSLVPSPKCSVNAIALGKSVARGHHDLECKPSSRAPCVHRVRGSARAVSHETS